MNVRNCRKCGKIFNYAIGPVICPVCKEATEAKFQEVKKYVMDNRGSGVKDIADNCDVDIPQIQQWIREERLVFSDDSAISIDCELCGAMIKTGRFCAKCKASMANDLNGAIRKKNEPSMTPSKSSGSGERDKVRFLDR